MSLFFELHKDYIGPPIARWFEPTTPVNAASRLTECGWREVYSSPTQSRYRRGDYTITFSNSLFSTNKEYWDFVDDLVPDERYDVAEEEDERDKTYAAQMHEVHDTAGRW